MLPSSTKTCPGKLWRLLEYNRDPHMAQKLRLSASPEAAT